jgi:hypothetical protein
MCMIIHSCCISISQGHGQGLCITEMSHAAPPACAAGR